MVNLYEKLITKENLLIIKFCKEIKETNIVKDQFWVKYENIDLKVLPESILNIPLILNIAPAIWAMNLHVKVSEIDSKLFYSLQNLKPALRSMYPELSWSGTINAEKKIQNSNNHSLKKNYALFFSGGLDSIFSCLSHLDQSPILIPVKGCDINLSDDKGWEIFKKNTLQFSKQFKLNISNIESNFLDFLNQSMLSGLNDKIYDWWSRVQHGMGFAGLIAPLMVKYNLNLAYIASSHSIKFTAPWGSDPKIDNLIEYSELKFLHDGFDLTRHDKVNEILKICSKKNYLLPQLRVCYSNENNNGENCCICEKCSRTMTAFWVENKNPNKIGFNISTDNFINNTKNKFKIFDFKFAENTLFHWQDIQKNIKSSVEYRSKLLPENIIEYLEWVKKFNFTNYKDEFIKRNDKRIKIIKTLSIFPFFEELKNLVKMKFPKLREKIILLLQL